MFTDPYADMRWTLETGAGLFFDDNYRLAQLPLVAPQHPRVLDEAPGRDYRYGRYDRARVSVVADIGQQFLENDTCKLLLKRLASSSFAAKIASELLQRRAANLHATLVSDVTREPQKNEAVRHALTAASVLRPRVHGPFIGRFNTGRIYMPLEFTRPEDIRLLGSLNKIFGKPRPRFTAVGIVNLREELNPDEAAELAAIIAEQRSFISNLRVDDVSWTATHDDLTLDMQRLETINLKKETRA